MQIELKLQHSLLAVETEHDVHAMVELSAPPLPVDRDRTPLSLALVLDRSGSMHGDKLATVRRCAAYLVDQLADDDELAIVTYDDAVELVAPLSRVGDHGVRPAMKHAITTIDSGGMTNLSGGWLKGLELLQGVGDERVRRVLLLTDGQANHGITDPDSLTGLARQAGQAGVGTTTIGYGSDFHEELLTAIADAGRGNAWYAATVDDAPAIFADEFTGLVEVVAQNLSVEVRPSDEVAFIGVLNEYPTVGLADAVQIQVGDAYAGQTLRVVFRLHVPELAGLGAAKLADVVVRYVTLGDTVEHHEVTHPLYVNLVSADEAADVSADPDVTEEVTILLAAKATEEARRLADEGAFDRARELLGRAVADIRAAAPRSDRAEELLAKAQELDVTAQAMDSGTYGAAESKTLHYRSKEIKNRRGRRD